VAGSATDTNDPFAEQRKKQQTDAVCEGAKSSARHPWLMHCTPLLMSASFRWRQDRLACLAGPARLPASSTYASAGSSCRHTHSSLTCQYRESSTARCLHTCTLYPGRVARAALAVGDLFLLPPRIMPCARSAASVSDAAYYPGLKGPRIRSSLLRISLLRDRAATVGNHRLM